MDITHIMEGFYLQFSMLAFKEVKDLHLDS
jgi:hypothetical protein